MIIDTRSLTSYFESGAPAKGFVVFEGVNGAGKTTLLNQIHTYLQSLQIASLVTREPGSPHIALGSAVRNLVLAGETGGISPIAEAYLFAADRAEHVSKVLLPKIQQRQFILCDRYVYSSIAFQGAGRELGVEEIASLNAPAIQELHPDLVFLLDLPPEEGLRRTKARETTTPASPSSDVLEKETLIFHQRVRKGFVDLAKHHPTPFVILDATQSPDALFQHSKGLIDLILQSRAQP